MSESLIKWSYFVHVGNQAAKTILCRLAYCFECSINELSFDCEISPRRVQNAINYLIADGFIRRREGVMPGYTSDKNDDTYQYELLRDIKRN